MSTALRRFTASWLFFWLILAAVSAWYLYPLRKKLKFGIDLVGGTYITLRVETEKAIEHELREKLQTLEESLKAADYSMPIAHKIEEETLTAAFDTTETARAAQSIIRQEFSSDVVADVVGSDLVFRLSTKKENELKRWAVESDVEVLRTRLNTLGVEEIKVTPQGERDIVVELPDVDDPAKAKEIIGKPAMLEFKLVESMAATKEQLLDPYGGDVPSGMIVLPYSERGRKEFVLVPDYAEITGRHLKDARPGRGGQFGTEAAVSFVLTSEGGKKFHELTSQNIGKYLAAILDNQVISVAVIQSAIGAEGQISGRSFTPEDVKQLGMLFRSGAFVAPVTFEEERSVGPALGFEAIKSGVISCTVGLALLFLFSIIIYKLSGFFAFLALLYNLLLMLIAMALFRATLTLPGIAGMVLTIGMAVDASILIYEKVRELLRAGETPRAAINEGFRDAMAVILDANITTFIVGVVLFFFGTGPVKGFAITLMIGIIATLVAGLFFLKSIFSAYFMIRKESKTLSI